MNSGWVEQAAKGKTGDGQGHQRASGGHWGSSGG